MNARLAKLKENPDLRYFDVIGIYKDENAYKAGYSYKSTFEQNISGIKNQRYYEVKERGEVIAIFFDRRLLGNVLFMQNLENILNEIGYSPRSALVRMHKIA